MMVVHQSRWMLLALALALTGASVAARAALASKPDIPYRLTSWTSQQGLPQNTVDCVLQTGNGYIWCGTRYGLVRFDGVQFTTFSDELNDVGMDTLDVRSLAEDTENRLWLSSRSALVCLSEGHFKMVPLPEAQRNARIQKIYSKSNGKLWIARPFEVLCLEDGLVTQTLRLNSTCPGDGEIDNLFEDSQGRLWVRTSYAEHFWWLCFNPENGAWTNLTNIVGVAANDLGGLTEGRGGWLWMARPGELLCWQQGVLSRFPSKDAWGDRGVKCLAEDLRGNVWIASEGGVQLHRFGQGTFKSFDESSGAMSTEDVRCVVPDREGNIWVGTGNRGLARLRPRELIAYLAGSYSTLDEVYSISPGIGDSVWLATADGLVQFQQGKFVVFTNTVAKHVDGWVLRARAALEDREGTVWAGTDRGLWTLRNGVFEQCEIPRMDGQGRRLITSILEDRRGVIWMGTPCGLLERNEGKYRLWGTNDGLSDPIVFGVAEGQDGSIWAGTKFGGINRILRGQIRTYGTRDGLLNQEAWPLRVEKDGTVWVGTMRGLNRIRGDEVRSVTMAQGLYDNLAYCLIEDGQNRYWSFCNRGIWRVNKSDLHAVADGRLAMVNCVHYDEGDGMLSAEGNGDQQPNACELPNGELWFPTTRGVVTLKPDEMQDNQVPPGVVIEQVRVDDELVLPASEHPGEQGTSTAGTIAARPLPKPGNRAPLHLPAGRARTVELRYTATTFLDSDQACFRYRLEGHESDWNEARTRRVAVYTNLRPGEYLFSVEACNSHGYWSKLPAQFAFSVAPFFYQTWGFYVACGVALAAGLAAWHTRRFGTRAHLQQLKQERAVLDERARIAKDLHDDLGANLTGIAMQIEVARRQLNQPQVAQACLESIANSARAMVNQMRDVVWSLNPQCDTLESFCVYISDFATGFLASAGLRCRLDLPDEMPDRRLSAEMRHHLMLVLKEALNNAARHARATEVRISLALESDALVLTVADNGRGFPYANPNRNGAHAELHPAVDPMQAKVNGGGRGLTNMNRRVGLLGGRFTIDSQLGLGTRMSVVIPLRSKR
jgi:signal transduction histidine kinase/ligand-binding sensor domain-containing protein